MQDEILIGIMHHNKIIQGAVVKRKDFELPGENLMQILLAGTPDTAIMTMQTIFNGINKNCLEGRICIDDMTPYKAVTKLKGSSGDREHECWLYNDQMQEFLSYTYDCGTRTWNSAIGFNKNLGISVYRPGNEVMNICDLGKMLGTPTPVDKWDHAQLTDSDLFFLITENCEASLYSDKTNAELLRQICDLQTDKDYRKSEWSEAADRLGYEIIHKGGITVSARDWYDNSAIAAQTMLAALQYEADRRIKKNFPDYNPLDQADETSIDIGNYALINTLAIANYRQKHSKNHELDIGREIIQQLADFARISYKKQRISCENHAVYELKSGQHI